MKNLGIFIGFTFFTTSLFAQNIEGTVIDSLSKAPIPFAIIHFIDIDANTLTDIHGHFRYQGQLPEPIKIRCAAVGYESRILQIKNKNSINIALQSSHIELKEVNISVSTGLIQKHSIAAVESKSIEELSEIISPNLSDAISNLAGVYNNSTGNGIGKPVIRGLTGNRVLTYLNGLRIENQQFGGDHGLGISELGIAQVDVIKGPSSLLYGADAMGGVIHFTDEKYTTMGNFESYLASQWESNTMGTKNSLGIKTAGKAIRLNVYAYFNSAADYQLPSGQYLGNSRFQESAGKFALGYNKKKWVINLRYSFQNSLIGLPGHSHDSIPLAESFKNLRQIRKYTLPVQKINSHFTILENVFYVNSTNELRLFTGFSSNNLKEFEEKVTIPGINNVLNTYSYHLRWKKTTGKNGSLLSGIQGQFQRNHNQAGAEEILIPQANLMDNGLYFLYQHVIKNGEIQAGIRYDTRKVESLKNFKGTPAQSLFFNGLNYSIGAYKTIKKITFRSNISSAYRPPHLNELMSNGVHHGTIRFEKGNVNLTPETAIQIDFSSEYEGEHLSFIVNPFFTQIQNYIYLNPKDSLVNYYPIFEYQQTANARLFGSDFGLHYHPHFLHILHLESTFSFIQAEENNGSSLPLTPASRFNSTLRLEINNKGFIQFENISLQHLYFLAQNQIALNETSSPAYQLMHIGAQVKLGTKQPIRIKFGVRNLFNEYYIDHLSRLKNIGLEAPGRNFYLGIKWNFIKSKSLHD